MDGKKVSGVIDDETPTSRAFGSEQIVPKWGQNKLDRERDAFTQKEIEIAEQIGLKD
jgi:hypothetical protein